MNSPLKCRLSLSAKKGDGHTSQIVTGFMMLKNQGIVDLEVRRPVDFPLVSMVEVVIDGDIRIAYDMADGYHFNLERVQKFLTGIDYVFKRSYNSACHSQYDVAHKVYPLGLNYHVTTPNNVLDKPNSGGVISKVKWYVKEMLGRNYHQRFFVENFEDHPKMNNLQPKILFSARTWGPGDDPNLNENETREMNETRASCIRKLRNHFGSNFVGGFPPRKEAVEHYPDIILDSSVTNRNNFVRLIKESDVCISTIGLHKSNGWKLAEYVAACKGIVSERLYYEAPNFHKDTHYLEFANPDECVEQAVRLAGDRDALYTMKRNNYDYYHNYLRPDKLVLNSLIKVID